MFPNLAVRETCAAETNFAARKQKMFSPGVKNTFASRTQILRPKRMFRSLATPGNVTRNIVSATMFPSLARPLRIKFDKADVSSVQGEDEFHFLFYNIYNYLSLLLK